MVRIIPFETQTSKRSCGAAALSMVYQSFGIDCSQEQLWQTLAEKSARGRSCSRAHAMALDAIGRGLCALVIQVRDPWLVLQRCLDQSVAAIINHVPEANSGGGHYSVLTDLKDDYVFMHDPTFGPNRVLARAEFYQLWNPRSKYTEILDQVLIAIADPPSDLEKCDLCRCESQDLAVCSSCRREVRIQPLAVLGCLTDWCPMRAWEQIFCPWCEHPWTKGLGQPPVSEEQDRT